MALAQGFAGDIRMLIICRARLINLPQRRFVSFGTVNQFDHIGVIETDRSSRSFIGYFPFTAGMMA